MAAAAGPTEGWRCPAETERTAPGTAAAAAGSAVWQRRMTSWGSRISLGDLEEKCWVGANWSLVSSEA